MNMAVPPGQMSPLEMQMAALAGKYPGATIQPVDGNMLVTVPELRVPPGWNKASVTVQFVLPAGYPHANPDCFYVEEDFRLENGTVPQNAQMQVLGSLGNRLWFSWHLQRPWKPGRDTLLSWMGVVAARFECRT